jgi:hypothetical protein
MDCLCNWSAFTYRRTGSLERARGDRATYQRTLKSICVLYRVVTVIPRSSILSSLKAISEALTRGNRTLRNAIDTIHIHGLILSNTVPVNAGAVTHHTVDNSNVKCL